MKKIGFTFAAVMLAALAVTAATSNGPYYALPAWDQKLDCNSSANCPRFVELSNWNGEAVLDRETGLVWEKSPTTTPRTWLLASVSCVQKTVGNRKGWRLPMVQELMSLVDPAQSNPVLPPGHPFNNVQTVFGYWSATKAFQVSLSSQSAFVVEYGTGTLSAFDRSDSLDVIGWCVRGGQGVETQ